MDSPINNIVKLKKGEYPQIINIQLSNKRMKINYF